MSSPTPFGRWLSARRHLLGLTQQQLARLAHCSVPTIRKVEADERRPSLEIAERLADSLHIAASERETFLAAARGRLSLEETGAAEPSLAPAPRASRTNLVIPLTPLIGRAQDVAAVRNRLVQQDERLLTLIGPPGIGKTRLSIAVAAAVQADFPDGVFFVALAPIGDVHSVMPAIAQAIGVMAHGDAPVLHRLQHALRDRHTLLVLDNVEQVVAAAPMVVELLQLCPGLKVLATSRTSLRVRGERLYPVPPLLLPDLSRHAHAADLAGVPSIALFVERAQAVQPNFQLTDENAGAIAMICARVDGLPLAIELVAARVRLLPPAVLLARLDSRLSLLTGGSRDLPPRHRTLRGAIAWSHELLDSPEQVLFRRLGVFVGGTSIDAAEAVCRAATGTPLAVIDGVQSLLDHSLLYQEPGGGEARFGMLETIREYALEMLEQHEEAEAVRRAHAECYVALVEAVEPGLLLPHSRANQELLGRNYDNIRAVFAWTLRPDAPPTDRDLPLRQVGALWWLWFATGNIVEGERWIPAVLDVVSQDTPAILRAKVLQAAAWLTNATEGRISGTTLLPEYLSAARELGDTAMITDALRNLANAAIREQRYREAQLLLEESLTVSQRAGDLLSEAYTFDRLGVLAESRQDYSHAHRWYCQSLDLVRTLGIEVFVGLELANVARIAHLQGDAGALKLHQEGLQLKWRHGWQNNQPRSLENIASIVLGHGDAARGVRLLSAAHRLRDRLGHAQPASDSDDIVWARSQLGEEAFAHAWAEGQAMTLEQAVADALDA